MSRCRACNDEIRWVRTAANDKLIPLNLEPDPAGNVEVVDGKAVVHADGQDDLFATGVRFMPHHATCTNWPPK